MTTTANQQHPNLTLIQGDTNPNPVVKPTDQQLVELAKNMFGVELTVEELNSSEVASTKQMLEQAFEKLENERIAAEQEQQKAEQSAKLKSKVAGLNAKLHETLHPPKGKVEYLSEEEIARRHEESLPKSVRVLEAYRKSHKGEVPDFILVADPAKVFNMAMVNIRDQKVKVVFKRPSDLLMAYRGYICLEHKGVNEQIPKIVDPVDKAIMEKFSADIASHVRLVTEIAARAFDVDFDPKKVSAFYADFPVFKYTQYLAEKSDIVKKVFTRPAIGEARQQIELAEAKAAEMEKIDRAEELARAEQKRKADEYLRVQIGGMLVSAGCEDQHFLMKAVTRLVKKFDGTAVERLTKAAIGQGVLSRTAGDEAERSATQAIATLYAKAAGLTDDELAAAVEKEIAEHHSAEGKKTPEIERKLTGKQKRDAAEVKRKARKAKENAPKSKRGKK